MANITFFYDNEWDGASALTSWTEHANFPKENTQLRDFNESWRSLYGTGSGWGKFAITASVNDRLDFEETLGVELTASLTPATYTAASLFAHLKTQMEAVGASTYTWEYLEAGSDINKFKVISNGAGGGGILNLLWGSGTNTARSVGGTVGWDTGAGPDDRTGALNYTATYIRIHTSDWLKVDLGSATNVLGFIVRGHNIQSGGSKNIKANATDAWGAPSVNEACTQNTKLLGKIFASVQSYRWWLDSLIDVDNPDGYVEAGRVFLGNGFQPGRTFLNRSRATKRVDQSIIKRAEGGQISTIQLEDYETWQYKFIVNSAADIASFETMFDAVKKSNPLWICEDPDNFPDKTYYCQFVDWQWAPLEESADYWGLTIQVEELI